MSAIVEAALYEITTRQRTRPEDWISNRSLPPLVTVSFENRPLDSALRRLSDMTGISIVVDVRATDKLHHAGQPGITAMLNNVPLDTAVRLLADMNELGVVAIDSVLYVTTKPNAEKLEKEQEARRQKMHDKEKKAVADPKETKKTNK